MQRIAYVQDYMTMITQGMCYGKSDLTEVIPPDRVFNILYDELYTKIKKEIINVY